jgi:hypothetical protein
MAALVCFACVLSLAASVRPAAANGISVLLDSNPVNFGVTQPQIVNGRTMVPLREIFEALGFTVNWQPDTQQITGIKGNLTIVLTVGSNTALVGQNQISLDVPPQVIQGRTMVPLRFIAESANTYVSWDGDNQIVRISTNSQRPPTGTPVAQGDYDPSKQLVLDAKVTQHTDMKIVLEPGALVNAAQVSLYALTANNYRLVLGADPIATNIPGVAGFDGALIKAKFIETGTLDIRRPVIEANGQMIYNEAIFGTDSNGNDTITACIKVAERDTSLAVSEATDQQWSQVQVQQD